MHSRALVRNARSKERPTLSINAKVSSGTLQVMLHLDVVFPFLLRAHPRLIKGAVADPSLFHQITVSEGKQIRLEPQEWSKA